MSCEVNHHNEMKCGSETKCEKGSKNLNEYLVDQMAFYGAYHSTIGNQIIHVIFVPILLITAFSLLSFVPLLMRPVKLVWFASSYFHTNTPLFIGYLLMYPATYIYIDFFSGLTWLPMGAFVWIMAMYLVDTMKCSLATLALVHICSWLTQFVGHAIIEKRQPALVDNLYNSIVLAPFFVWFETVLFPLGYGNSAGLKRSITRKIKALQLRIDNKA